MEWENGAVPVPEPETVPAVRSYNSVLESIEASLRSGEIKVGDQLPGERALALKHGISRASVRDAIRVLDAMWVDVVPSLPAQHQDITAAVLAFDGELAAHALQLHIEWFHAQTLPVQ